MFITALLFAATIGSVAAAPVALSSAAPGRVFHDKLREKNVPTNALEAWTKFRKAHSKAATAGLVAANSNNGNIRTAEFETDVQPRSVGYMGITMNADESCNPDPTKDVVTMMQFGTCLVGKVQEADGEVDGSQFVGYQGKSGVFHEFNFKTYNSNDCTGKIIHQEEEQFPEACLGGFRFVGVTKYYTAVDGLLNLVSYNTEASCEGAMSGNTQTVEFGAALPTNLCLGEISSDGCFGAIGQVHFYNGPDCTGGVNQTVTVTGGICELETDDDDDDAYSDDSGFTENSWNLFTCEPQFPTGDDVNFDDIFYGDDKESDDDFYDDDNDNDASAGATLSLMAISATTVMAAALYL